MSECKENLKAQLYRELELKNDVSVQGISVDTKIFEALGVGSRLQEQVHRLSEFDHEQHVGIEFPVAFTTPNGFRFPFCWDRRSPFAIGYEEGRTFLSHQGEELFPIEFQERPAYYGLRTSDGTDMHNVLVHNGDGTVIVGYSNECSLKEKGLDCLFCNVNATKDAYAEHEGIFLKTPQQVGEATAAAYKEGNRHITITGGFVPERRELEYYCDAAEAIRELTGLDDFNGTATIGAPLDLKVLDKYKEAGFRTVAMNIEIWDRNIFKAICPGKEEQCGGYDHWVKALEHAVDVFGYGRVRSNIVAGIEPKQSILEGVEYLASKGVVCFAGAWRPNPGSALEGHRSPEPAWHFDLAKRVAAIHRKAGFSYDQLYDCSAAPFGLVHDIYRIEDELLSVFDKKAA